jgi:hypothetical protein
MLDRQLEKSASQQPAAQPQARILREHVLLARQSLEQVMENPAQGRLTPEMLSLSSFPLPD